MRISYAITPFPAVRSNRNSSWTPRAKEYHEKMNHLRVLANAHKDIIRQALIEARCSITFIFPIPDSWSKKKKLELIGQYHTQKPDLDNLYK
jgi:Holliday junction resolvase RusA-like endonuclease